MQASPVVAVFVPASLVLIMFAMGMTLEAADFRRILLFPRSVATGVAAQLVLVPLCGLAVVSAIPLEPRLAAGVMIIAACPGGAVSNLVSFLARGDVALSVTLTACSSMLTLFTLPLVVNASLAWLTGQTTAVELPLLSTSAKLFALTVAPIVAGMLIRRWKPMFARRSERHLAMISAIFLAAVIVLAVSENLHALPHYLRVVGPAVVALNVTAMVAGWLLARAAGLDARQRVTIAIETGIQNGALGIAIPATFIGDAEMAIPPAIYGVVMLVTSVIVAAIRRRRTF